MDILDVFPESSEAITRRKGMTERFEKVVKCDYCNSYASKYTAHVLILPAQEFILCSSCRINSPIKRKRKAKSIGKEVKFISWNFTETY